MEMTPTRRPVAFVLLVIALLALAAASVLLLRRIWPVLEVFIIAGLLAVALERLVQWQMAHRIPRWLAAVNILVLFALLGGWLLYFLVPPFVGQFRGFLVAAPDLWNLALARWGAVLRRFPELQQTIDLHTFVINLLRGAGSWAETARTVFASATGFVTASILVFVTVLYTLLGPWPLLYGLRGLFPADWWPTLDRLATLIAARLRGWVLGTVVLGAIIGALDFLALTLINLFFSPPLPFVLFFALLGGLLEIVPVIGPLISAILPALVGFSLDPLLGIVILLAFTLIQQLENHLIVPNIMRRAVNLHPVTTIFALAVMATLFGIFGAIIAVPVASILKVLYDEWYYPLLHDGQRPAPPPDAVR